MCVGGCGGGEGLRGWPFMSRTGGCSCVAFCCFKEWQGVCWGGGGGGERACTCLHPCLAPDADYMQTQAPPFMPVHKPPLPPPRTAFPNIIATPPQKKTRPVRQDKNPAPLNQLDSLMNETYGGLMELGSDMEAAQVGGGGWAGVCVGGGGFHAC